MLNFCSLYSGSSGNSLFIESDSSKILIDVGVSSRKVEQALDNIDVKPSDIDAILITHEHSDHVQGLGTFSKKFNLPVFVNQQTLDAMPAQRDKIPEENIHIYKPYSKFEINDFEINPFKIPHDAANPCGFNLIHDNKKISIATDIGHMSKDVLKNLEDSSFILLESNYDPNVLQCSPYPYYLKTRIAGDSGHLSNQDAGKTICHLLKSGLKTAMLGHLSKNSNFPELAYKTVLEEIISSSHNTDSLALSVANRESTSKFITI